MEEEFKGPVTYLFTHQAFVGEGIPPIPEDATCLVASSNTIVYVSPRGEAWESFVGKGTSSKSQTFYWPDVKLCPRAWALGLKGHKL